MNRAQKKELRQRQNTRQLMGISQLTGHGAKTAGGELVFFMIKPDNLSVLSGEGIRGRIKNLTDLVELLEAEGLRSRVVLCCGGARITHELAKELGYDAGFGAGKYADDVATFAVTEMVARGLGKK